MTVPLPERRRDHAIAPVVLAVSVTLVIIVLSVLLARQSAVAEQDAQREEVAASLAVAKSQLEQGIAERTVLADALAAFVRTDPGYTEASFRAFARSLLELQPDVRALQLAPGAVIRSVEPLVGNEAAVDLDLRAYSLQQEVVRRAIESERFVVGGPIPLIQTGRSGMVARLAVDLDLDDDPATPDEFWGLVQVVFDTAAVTDDTVLPELREDLDVVLRGVDGLGAEGEVFDGDLAALDEPVTTEVVLPGGSWQVLASPRAGWVGWGGAAIALLVGGLVLALLGGWWVWTTARLPARLRRRVEEATAELRAGRQWIANVMNAAPDGILAVDDRLDVRDGNPAAAALLGRSLEDVVGQPLASLLDAIPADGRRVVTEVQRDDGTTVAIEVALDRQPDLDGSTVVLHDITERRRATQELQRHSQELEHLNQELQRLDALKRDFLDMASHEVRTPITAIRGFSLTLATRWDELSEPDRRRSFEVIHRQTERLWRLVDDLLVASRLESGRVSSDISPTNVATVISRAVDEADLPRSQCLIACPSALEVEVARDHLHRILSAFLSNAGKYGEPPIVIEAELSGGALVVKVTDEGPGVPPAFRGALFDSFTQASTGSTRTAKGTGLGLAVARGLAASIGGRVRYEEAATGGACFVAELPLGRLGDEASSAYPAGTVDVGRPT